MPDPASTPLKSLPKFGRRIGRPQKLARRDRFRPSPALLASALGREKPGSLRRLVLERLYRNLTPAEQGLCDAVRFRMASSKE
jgi:hypothetical protein